MRIATFNVNGINKRLQNLEQWLTERRPDVVALQEIKCFDADFPFGALEAAGYGAIVRGQGPHHGVALLARDSVPIETRRELPGDTRDHEARYIEAAVAGILFCALYLPNGNPQPGPKFNYKLAWFERLIGHTTKLRIQNVPAIVLGDFNVVPTDFDIYSTRSWTKNALLQPAPRAAYARLVAGGWTDAIRTLYPNEPMYTFWHYFRDAWPRDAGWRLDHLLLSEHLAPRLMDGGVDREVRARPNASDHAPAWIELDVQ
jgi:exodeoxyribonuclease III